MKTPKRKPSASVQSENRQKEIIRQLRQLTRAAADGQVFDADAAQEINRAWMRIIAFVHAHGDPRLLLSRNGGYRPGEKSFHGTGDSQDFSHPDPRVMYRAFIRLMRARWPGGLGIGLPPADMHIHVDHRQTAGKGDWAKPCYFIETGKPDGSGNVAVIVRQGRDRRVWRAALRRVRERYAPKVKRRG